MVQELSQSRFNMWRTVVALAHADGRVTTEERDMVERYLAQVPFSASQREVLQDDLINPKDFADMFDTISERADQGEFFEFARMILWSDGDFAAQEEKIFEYLQGTQMHRINKGAMQALVRETKESGRITRMAEDMEYEAQARKHLSLTGIISKLTGQN